MYHKQTNKLTNKHTKQTSVSKHKYCAQRHYCCYYYYYYYYYCQQIRIGDLTFESMWSYPLSHDNCSCSVYSTTLLPWLYSLISITSCMFIGLTLALQGLLQRRIQDFIYYFLFIIIIFFFWGGGANRLFMYLNISLYMFFFIIYSFINTWIDSSINSIYLVSHTAKTVVLKLHHRCR